MIDTRVTYTPFMLYFIDNFKKEPHIGDTTIILSLRTWSITPNVEMIQSSNISCGGTNQSWSYKIAKDQDLTEHML